MPIVRYQMTFQGSSGLPDDVYVNTFYVDHGSTIGAGGPEAASDAIWDFYTLGHVETSTSIAGYFGHQVAQNDHEIRAYNLSDPEPRVPIFTKTYDLSFTPTAEGYPAEVALCLSYSADVASGENAARRRGRIYLGPLKNTSGDPAGGDTRPVSVLIEEICLSATDLVTSLGAADAASSWVVYSPTDNAGRDITHGYVDNAFDTQRRRGSRPTGRTTWP